MFAQHNLRKSGACFLYTDSSSSVLLIFQCVTCPGVDDLRKPPRTYKTPPSEGPSTNPSVKLALVLGLNLVPDTESIARVEGGEEGVRYAGHARHHGEGCRLQDPGQPFHIQKSLNTMQ